MLPYSLTPSAQADLEEIARYTLEKWGEQQAMQYAASLDDCFENIAQGRASHHAFSKTLPQVQVTRCEHHYPADERVPHCIEAAPGRKPMRKGVPAAVRLLPLSAGRCSAARRTWKAPPHDRAA